MAAETRPYDPRFQWRFLAPRFWLTWFGLGLLAILSLLPWWTRAALARWLGRLAASHDGYRQRVARVNLAMAFPDKTEAERETMLYGLYRTMVQSLLDYGVLWWGSRRRLRRLVRAQGMESLVRAHAEGRKVILLTGHNVALDYGAVAMTLDVPGVGLIKRARNPLLDWMMGRGRLRFQSILYERDSGLRPVIRAIREGSVFYYLPDEDLAHVKGSEWVFTPFFGVQTATITALSRLAKITDAVIMPAMTYYVGRGQYQFRIGPALKDYPSGDLERDARVQSEVIEAMIREYPEQYMWTLTVFSTRPDGGDSPYHGLKERASTRRQ
ncbi:MAG: lipid A biosynthesis acyltransferase [Gammaproteobacteria bacterium]|nr:lipid A biosynthesis acyltransferase [Gammaproteobacteria bacterium]